MEGSRGVLTSIISVLSILCLIWFSLVIPLTFSEVSESYARYEPVGCLSRYIVSLFGAFETLSSYDEFKEHFARSGVGRFIYGKAEIEGSEQEFKEIKEQYFKLRVTGFIAAHALKSSENLCRSIPFLSNCRTYILPKIVRRKHFGVWEGIADGLYVGTTPLFIYVILVGVILFPQGLVIEYFIAFLISCLVSLIGSYKLVKLLISLPSIDEYIAGAILGAMLGGIVSDLNWQTMAIGAILGALIGIMLMQRSVKSFLNAIFLFFEYMFLGASQRVIDAIIGGATGALIRIAIHIWMRREISGENLIQIIKGAITLPEIIAWGIFGCIIGAVYGIKRATREMHK